MEETKRSLLPSDARRATIRRITDGDTVETQTGEKIRYIGIDTPEREDSFYREATEFNRALIEGKEVFLEHDVEPTDTHGRTLAYVWTREGEREILVNAELVRAGLAKVYTHPPNVRHTETFQACQQEARREMRGMWKNYVLGGEEYYVATQKGRAYHRPSCKDISKAKDFRKFKDQGEALDIGLSPCRNCKP